MKRKVLITGGAGFLGTALAGRLANDSAVVLLDNLRRDSLRYSPLRKHPNVSLMQADVCDPTALDQAVRGCDWVVHLASLAGVATVGSDPVGTLETNMLGIRALLRACKRQGELSRLVIVSSSEVYGDRADGVSEQADLVPGQMGAERWSYAVSKLAAEYLALAYHRQHGLPVTVLRPFNIYGPGQTGLGAVRTFVCRALAGLPLALHNGGTQTRAWCYVDDFTEGMLAALQKDAAVGEVFNLGNPDCVLSSRALAEQVQQVAGVSLPLLTEPLAGPSVSRRVPNIDKARRLLGFRPRVAIDQGLGDTVAWYREQARDLWEGDHA